MSVLQSHENSVSINSTNDVEMANQQDSTIGVVQIMRKRKAELASECKRRPYLDGKYFDPDLEKSSVNGVIVGICQLCKVKWNKHHAIKGSLQTPSNYNSHIQKVHHESLAAYKEYVTLKRQKKSDDADQIKSYCDFSQAKFEENVINYILETMAPFNTVECSSFKKIFDDMKIKKGGKKLTHLSARTVGRRIIKTFNKNIDSIKTMISSAKYVCTTADVWTSKSRRFIGMTVHWIDEITFVRKSYAIACRRFPGTHSYDRVAKMIEEIHQSFEINQDKVVATVTDNGSNFVKAFSCCGININEFFSKDGDNSDEAEINDEDSSSDLEENSNSDSRSEDLESEEEIASEENEWAEKQSLEKDEEDELERTLPAHIRCASHTLNLVATSDAMVFIKSSKSLEVSYNKMIERCTSLWKLLSAPKKWENVKEILGKSPKRPVPTRWNSLYDALIQLFGLKEKILSNVQTLGMATPLEESDFRFMEEYCRCLQPIAQAIDVLQGDQTASYGHLLPTLIMTRKKLLACKDLRFHYCQKLIPGLVEAVEKRFKNIFDVVNEGKTAAVAAASHPMFKLRWLSHLSKEAQDNVMKAVQDAIISFPETPDNQRQQLETSSTDDFFNFDDQLSITAASTPVIPNSLPASSTSPNSSAASGSSTTPSSSTPKPFGTTVQEVNFIRFTSETRTDFQILNLYPTVREIFLKTNTILPSSAPVERLFSYATMYDLPKYNKLTNQNFELRVIMKCNASIAKKK